MEAPSRPVTGYPLPNGRPPPPPPSTGMGYAYQTRPRPPPGNPYFYNQPYLNARATLFRRVMGGLIIVTIIFFIILLICWLVVRPHLPVFHITSFTVSKFNLSSQAFTGNWNAQFQVYNPNKKLKISYDTVESMVLYKSEILAQTRLPPFNQDTKSTTTINASFSALGTYVSGWAVEGINKERSGGGGVEFNVRVSADVGFYLGNVRARRRWLRVVCGNVVVGGLSGNNSSGNFTGGVRKCLAYV